jgi:glycine betaine/proline transport system substrate-binding protein
LRATHGRILGVAALLLLLALLVAGCGGQKPVIKLHAWETDSHFLNNAIAEFIIEEGYGYPVETVVETTPAMQEAIQKGNIDLNLEGWQQNIPDWYKEQIEEGTIVNLGMTYEDSGQFFIIPQWVAQEYNINTVFDMRDHWKLFQDPEDPSKGIFYNCVIGSQCAKINEVKLEAYGLIRYYNPVSPPSYAALETVLARPQERHQPVFGYYWVPTGLMGAYNWYVLEEPAYSPGCWEVVVAASEDESLRPIDQACAYEALPIDKVAYKGLLRKAPEVVEMLRNMVVGLEPLNDTLAWADKNHVQDWKEVAIHYLQNYEGRWKTWVAPEAYEKVKEALTEASS